MTESVLNRVEQTAGNSQDNKYVFGGTVETADGQSLKIVRVTHQVTDISSAESFVINPGVNGTIIEIRGALQDTIATANAAITTNISGTPITNGGITVLFSGSAEGDLYTATPTAANVITDTDYLGFSTDGASTNAREFAMTFVIALA
jgi:hypothetical protein